IFEIEDQGIGILPEDESKIFNSFYRASNVETIPGTGLGLAIVKKAVDLHGGKISFHTQVGIGTRFTVSLPC
ncbi:MAG: sensor histidine kinase, partial [Cyanobacteria bacterium J06635_10]